jgi:hypothetical protein
MKLERWEASRLEGFKPVNQERRGIEAEARRKRHGKDEQWS